MKTPITTAAMAQVHGGALFSDPPEGEGAVVLRCGAAEYGGHDGHSEGCACHGHPSLTRQHFSLSDGMQRHADGLPAADRAESDPAGLTGTPLR